MKTFHLDFVGVGPQRTGTSWLHQILAQHPSLCLPEEVDEPMFFDVHYDKGLARYAAYFALRKEDQLCGEFSPTYFDVQDVPARIYQVSPSCKIIINLREPISRTVSLYRHHLSKGRVQGSFTEAASHMARIVDSGKYASHIPCWLDTFGADRVTFVLLDDIKAQPETVLKQVYDFLGVEDVAMPHMAKEKYNALTPPRFPWLARTTAQLVTTLHGSRLHKVVNVGKSIGLRDLVYSGGSYEMPGLTRDEYQRLQEEFKPDIAFLEDLLDRDLATWRQEGLVRIQEIPH